MIAADPTRVDHWRAPTLARRLEEWHHILVVTSECVLLLNCSVSRAESSTPLAGRVIAMVWHGGWSGAQQSGSVEVSADGCDARFAGARLRIEPRGWRILVDGHPSGIACDLRLSPWADPMTIHNHPLAPGRRMHWIMYPRLHASGFVTMPDGRALELRAAPAYHDHNWGDFAWGDDFSWTWGVILPFDRHCPYTAVFSDLQDRARSRVRMQHIFIWRDRHAARVVEGDAVEPRGVGRWIGQVQCTVPPVMGLLTPNTQDLPRRFEATARDARGDVRLSFDLDDVARVVVPDARDPLGVVVLNEVTGRARIDGLLHGEPVAVEGRGVFEFLR